MKNAIKFLFLITFPLTLIGCEAHRKLPDIELMNILNAHVNADGYPVINFEITNSKEVPICVPISMFEGENSYYAILDVRTKDGLHLKEKERNGRPNIGSRELIRIPPSGQKTNIITVNRGTVRKLLNGNSGLSVQLKFWGGIALVRKNLQRSQISLPYPIE